MEAIGSGLVILVDGREIKDTNLTKVELGSPSRFHLVTHVMSKFDTYNLKRKMHIQSSHYV
jgi:cyanophycinase